MAKYKGRKLHSLSISNVRPTQSRVKKSIMDKIMSFDGTTILDLYAGVGTLGIESLSRGGSYVCFVEKNFRVAKLLKKNLDLLSINDNYKIEISDTIRFLKNTCDKFDIIFADPPYYKYDFLDFFDLIKPISCKLSKGKNRDLAISSIDLLELFNFPLTTNGISKPDDRLR